MNLRSFALRCFVVLCALTLVRFYTSPITADDKKGAEPGGDWAATVKFPASEKPVQLFNGKDFTGWEGNTGEGGTPKYFSIKEGVIVARNEADNAPKVSNYLFTKKKYRNFRLVFEG